MLIFRSALLRKTLLCGVALGGLTMGAGTTASALEADKPSPGARIEEVVVTARRRAERLIDVPVAAATLSNKGIERYNSVDLAQIAQNLPGVTLGRNGGASNGGAFSIRGVGNLAADLGNEQPVAINIDGVQTTRGRIASIGLFDVQQVEVLKGPQALFFGKNSPAGVVSITSKGPGTTFEGYMRGAYEFRTKTPQVEGAVSIPITDKLGVRLAGRWAKMYGGYIYNDAKPIPDPYETDPATGLKDLILPGGPWKVGPGTKNLIGRITVDYKPSSDLDMTLKVLASRETQVAANTTEEVQCGPLGATAPTEGLNPVLQDPNGDCTANRHLSNGFPEAAIVSKFLRAPSAGSLSLSDNIVSGFTANYHLKNLTLTSVTGFYYDRGSAFDNYDRTTFGQALNSLQELNRQYTQEFRAVTSFDGPLNFSAGTYFQFDNRHTFTTSKLLQTGPLTAAGAPLVVGPQYNPADYVGYYNTGLFLARNLVTVYSGFGQARLKILPGLELAAGARFTREQKKTDIGAPLSRLASQSQPGYFYHPHIDNDNVSPEVTLTWKPQADITTYVAYKTGFLAAGIQNPGGLSNYHGTCLRTQPATVLQCENGLLTYKPETVKGFEGGIKGYLMDRRVRAELAIYKYDFHDLQVSTYDPVALAFNIQTAGGSVSKGAEFQVEAVVTSELTLRTSLSYTSLHYTDYSGGPCYSGQPINPFVPLDQRTVRTCYAIPGTVSGEQFLNGAAYGEAPFQSDFGGTYKKVFSSGAAVQLDFDYYYYSRAPRGISAYMPGGEEHSLVSASARFISKDDRWELALIGTNLTDDIWFPISSVTGKPFGRFTATTGDYGAYLQPPREVTLQVTRRF